jgi:hypothetical protein
MPIYGIKDSLRSQGRGRGKGLSDTVTDALESKRERRAAGLFGRLVLALLTHPPSLSPSLPLPLSFSSLPPALGYGKSNAGGSSKPSELLTVIESHPFAALLCIGIEAMIGQSV